MITPYYELMEKRLEQNRHEVEKLQKREYIIGKVMDIHDDMKALGAETRFEESSFTISTPYNKRVKLQFKDVKILLDEAIFSDPRLETTTQNGTTYMFIRVKDTITGGSYSIDINMDRVVCKKIQVSRREVLVEQVQYRWDCEG